MSDLPPVWISSTAHGRLGAVWVAVGAKGLVAVLMGADETEFRGKLAGYEIQAEPGAAGAVAVQLQEYLSGRRRLFELTIDWSVLSQFQAEVLQEVWAIPYGKVRSYQQIGEAIGKPGAARAVGRANATNPMAPIVPCHRVLGSDGSLHGYGGPGGVETKAWLLRLEGSRLL